MEVNKWSTGGDDDHRDGEDEGIGLYSPNPYLLWGGLGTSVT